MVATALPHRSALLALAVTILLLSAGCIADPDVPVQPGEDEESPSPTPPPTTPPTKTADSSPTDRPGSPTTDSPAVAPGTPLPNTTVELPDGPKERPERPETLTRDSVAEYAETFEYRYVYNSLWYNQYSNVSVTCELESVGQVDVGWKAVVSCTAYSNTGGPATGTESPTVVHADWFTQTFTYLIDENSTVRREATEEEAE